MVDFVLIIPKIRKRKEKVVPPPFVFLKLAAVLEKNGLKSILIDGRIETDYLQKIRQAVKNESTIIGITSMTGFQSVEGFKIAKFIKNISPKTSIIWGGVHASLLPEEVLNSGYVDVVVIGEGEASIVLLVNKLKSNDKSFSDIEGIAFKDGNNIKINIKTIFLDLNSLPMPAWHLVENRIQNYFSQDGQIDMITSVGCPHDCYFCYNMSYNKSKFRARSANNVVDEINILYDKYRIKKIGFCDDNFMVDKNRVIQICEELRKRNITLEMQCDVRIDYIKEDIIAYLVRNGFKKFFLGIESGSQKILDLINKRVSVQRVREGILTLSKYTQGGHTYSLMVGFPGETKKDIAQTWELARWIYSIDKRAKIILNTYTPYPGVELTKRLAKEGYSIPKTNSEWLKYDLCSIESKKWVHNKRLIKSLINIFRVSSFSSNNKITSFLSKYAKRRLLYGKFKPYLEFEILYYLIRNF